MFTHPVVAGFELDEAEQHLMAYWLDGHDPPCRRVTQQEILRGRGGLMFLAAATLENLRELLEWNVPLLTVLGHATTADAPVREDLRQSGAAALWQLPAPGELFATPPLTYPVRALAFLLDDRQQRRRLYRQLLFFCGYDVRIDFQSSADMLALLARLDEGDGADPGAAAAAAGREGFPALLIIDLDSRRLDARAFFPALRRFFEDHPGRRRDCRVLITKDFRHTGTDLNLLAAHIRPLARRVFTPEEAVFALLEGLLYSAYAAPAHRPPFTPRDLRDLLLGDQVAPVNEFPLPARADELHRRAQLFRWLYSTAPAGTGLLLKD